MQLISVVILCTTRFQARLGQHSLYQLGPLYAGNVTASIENACSASEHGHLKGKIVTGCQLLVRLLNSKAGEVLTELNTIGLYHFSPASYSAPAIGVPVSRANELVKKASPRRSLSQQWCELLQSRTQPSPQNNTHPISCMPFAKRDAVGGIIDITACAQCINRQMMAAWVRDERTCTREEAIEN